MKNISNNVLGTIALLTSLFSVHTFANVQIIGSESELSHYIAEHYQQSTQFYEGNLAKTDALYINGGTASKDDVTLAKSYIVKGNTVVIDLRQVPGDDAKIELSQSLIGLGNEAPVIVTGMYQGENIINAIVADVRDENGDVIYNSEANLDSIKLSLAYALDRLGFGGK
ncbi:cytolysin secretion protein [Vibrio splendidus]|uniref:Cytolysin secretion protein n=1 Tax=Vibrio splendidus TaxID=29497 RepID=A0A2N7P5N8_VIBSP|nr:MULTISPECIES: hypothetical protein [Vibrio]OEF48436.1 cytolysin secretion protein [Vibrio cyclitrophicus 1F273]OEF72624.1 cytolysin secretion protein [Vibrio splendidus 1F-157]PMH86832.1 cytolysin secretion protein [Vibrio splendidus]PMI50438.1 cytolysin secretion protein [Vibrio splendidus]PMI72755.1 cytolysin secretion protein [Vibrio splendidus]